MPRPTSEEVILKHLGDALKEARIKREISQDDLASAASISRNYYNSVENGHRNIGIVNIVRLIMALEIENVNEVINSKKIKMSLEESSE